MLRSTCSRVIVSRKDEEKERKEIVWRYTVELRTPPHALAKFYPVWLITYWHDCMKDSWCEVLLLYETTTLESRESRKLVFEEAFPLLDLSTNTKAFDRKAKNYFLQSWRFHCLVITIGRIIVKKIDIYSHPPALQRSLTVVSGDLSNTGTSLQNSTIERVFAAYYLHPHPTGLLS
jgi:hypothetical protein